MVRKLRPRFEVSIVGQSHQPARDTEPHADGNEYVVTHHPATLEDLADLRLQLAVQQRALALADALPAQESVTSRLVRAASMALLRLFVQGLALFATSLDRWFHIPWPLPIAVLFVPVLAALDVVVWYLREMVFPIYYGYPRGEQGCCRRPAICEWHKCWYRGVGDCGKGSPSVTPNLRRWETL